MVNYWDNIFDLSLKDKVEIITMSVTQDIEYR